jgi:hypothetical protein
MQYWALGQSTLGSTNPVWEVVMPSRRTALDHVDPFHLM